MKDPGTSSQGGDRKAGIAVNGDWFARLFAYLVQNHIFHSHHRSHARSAPNRAAAN